MEIESKEEPEWLVAEFLMKGLLTLYSNITKVSTIIKDIFNIKNILQILKGILKGGKNKRSVGTHFPIRIKESGYPKMYQSSLHKLHVLIFSLQTVI